MKLNPPQTCQCIIYASIPISTVTMSIIIMIYWPCLHSPQCLYTGAGSLLGNINYIVVEPNQPLSLPSLIVPHNLAIYALAIPHFSYFYPSLPPSFPPSLPSPALCQPQWPHLRLPSPPVSWWQCQCSDTWRGHPPSPGSLLWPR